MKKLLKSLFNVFMVFVLTISLFACGQKENNVVSNNGQAKEFEFTVGVCQLVEHEALDLATEGFVAKLKEYFGNKINIIVKNAQGETNNCALIINEFVAQDVDLIMANATPALQAAQAATTKIPILGTSITEYGTALSIDNFNGVVGSNVSGTSDLAPLDEQAKMIKEIFPNTKTVGLIYCSSEANSLYQVKVMKEELQKLGIEASEYPFSDSNDLAQVTTNAVDTKDLIYVPTDNTVASNAGIIDNIARPAKKPVVTGEEGPCKICGTVSLTINYKDLGTKTGQMAYDILTENEKIEKMHIEYAPKVTKKYNKEICKELNISIPNDFVAIE